ncbi:MAG: 16S rRNA (uracil(1498)-N(3))-methyltransferase [Planctomycetaceae bacterium]
MSERFYLPGPLDLPELRLSGPEAHHLAHVLRLGPGATVTLFDGTGRETAAKVVAVSKRDVALQPRSSVRTSGATPIPVTLAVSPPKGDRFRWIVEKATELDVTRLVPLLTQRSVVDPRDGKLDKLRQTVIAACKQSGRNRLMEITPPTEYPVFLDSEAANDRRLLLHPGATPLMSIDIAPETVSGITLLIGPEGGFTTEEVDQAVAGGVLLASLGRTILRTETAALAAAAIVILRGVQSEPRPSGSD